MTLGAIADAEIETKKDRDSDATHHLLQGMSLRDVAFNYHAIDKRARLLLKEESPKPFEGVTSEAQPDVTKDAIHSLLGYHTARQLAELYKLYPGAGWERAKNCGRDALE